MFIDEWLTGDEYYIEDENPRGHGLQFGRIVWTHFPYTTEHLELWRPIPSPDEPTKTVATAFSITPARQDAFQRPTPLATPRLRANEEFLVVRAKRRPALVVQYATPNVGQANSGYRTKADRRTTLVAPIFSLADRRTGNAKYAEEFVERVRKLEWPQFMFLPRVDGCLHVDSLARLDSLFPAFTPHLDPTPVSLGDPAKIVVRGQLSWLLADCIEAQHQELREMLMGEG